MASRKPEELLSKFEELREQHSDSGDAFFKSLDTDKSGGKNNAYTNNICWRLKQQYSYTVNQMHISTGRIGTEGGAQKPWNGS